MKRILIFLLLLSSALVLFAQDYPDVTIRDVNYVERDSLLYYGALGTEPKPPLAGVSPAYGDTVYITGVVMNPPHRGADPDSAITLAAGAAAVFLQDTAMTEWSGVLLRDPAAHSDFAILDTGIIIRAKVAITEYFTTTEADIVDFSAADVIGYMERPQPVLLTLDSLFERGTNKPNYLAEKWEGVYVEFRDLTTYERGVVGSGTFKIIDENNTNMVVYNKSYYIRSGYSPPLDGTSIKSIRGFIETRTGGNYGWFMINPIYRGDIEYGDVTPPVILNVLRSRATVNYNEDVVISAQITDPDGSAGIVSAKLYYAAGDDPYVSVDMELTDPVDSIWSAAIPPFTDSTIVKYYIEVMDADNAVSNNPTGGASNPYFYLVLNRSLLISDVQYSPFGTGFSGYNNYTITVSGVVTADTSDIEGDGSNIGPQVYIQDGTALWSGIQIFGTQADNLKRGDFVTVTGIVNENFSITRIGTLDNGVQVTVNQTGVELPEPISIATSEINAAIDGNVTAEAYEGMLVKYDVVTVTDENADGNAGPDEGSGGSRNFGEMLVADKSGVTTRVEVQDGTHDYHNYWDFLQIDQPIKISTGDTFQSITGILFFSFGNYKLVPRKNDDFQGHVTDVEPGTNFPIEYSLMQNYPNPFNPATKIRYSIPEAGFVKLSVYNVLGQEVASLVNEFQTPGNHEVELNALYLSSGMYIYKLSTNGFNSVKKMMLLK